MNCGVLVCALAAVSCAQVGPHVWVDDYKPASGSEGGGEYRIAPGDLLAVHVYREDAMSTRERVRQDGKVSVSLLHDVQAAGLTPKQLAEQIQTPTLLLVANALRRNQIQNRCPLIAQESALIRGRQETGAPVLGTAHYFRSIRQDYKARQILVRGTEAISHP